MENKRKFGMRDNLAYAAGDFGCNMSFALKGTLIIFWTQFMKMDSLVYAGLLLLVQVFHKHKCQKLQHFEVRVYQ